MELLLVRPKQTSILSNAQTLSATPIRVAAIKKSDHFDGEKFFNPWFKTDKNFSDFLRWQLTANRKAWPKWRPLTHKAELNKSLKPGELNLSFVNHATMLVESKDFNFITDPVFSNRVSPSQAFGPKRVTPCGLHPEEIKKLDAVLLSHNHYDHLDKLSVQKIVKLFNPIFYTPLGNGQILKSYGVEKVVELDWWESITHGEHLITLTPAQHWSGRALADRRKALWGGFMVSQLNWKLYFAGDTGYAPFFQQINETLGPPDIALLPIGAYEPRWFMRSSHMNPEEAVKAHQDLGAHCSVAIHFGTWRLTDEGIDQPVVDLETARSSAGLKAKDFLVMGVGESRLFNSHSLRLS